jgi:dihydropteroate synthase
MLSAGASILDVGACSTRPGSEPVSQAEELAKLHSALDILDKELPDAVVSVDTFRAAVVKECVKEHNVSIINDVSGFDWDAGMFDAVVEAAQPYVLTHSADVKPLPHCTPQVLTALSQKMWQLHQAGVRDVIIDPGFGFGKTLEQNYELFANLREFAMLEAPMLVGVSRKSMITKRLGVSAAEALEGTVALNTMALDRGADILRVHDVKEAAQVVAMWRAVNGI